MASSLSSCRIISWALLIALALFVRAVVPQGYMTQESATGGIEVALCNSDGTWVIPMAEHENGHEEESDHSGSACQFGGHSEAGDTPQIASVLQLDVRRAAFSPDIVASLSLRHVRPIPPATGPPVTV